MNRYNNDRYYEPEDELTEEELEELRAYGLETGEKEDKSEYVLKVSSSQSLHFHFLIL